MATGWQVSMVMSGAVAQTVVATTVPLAAPQQSVSDVHGLTLAERPLPWDMAFSHLAPVEPAAFLAASLVSRRVLMVARLVSLVAAAVESACL